MGRRIKVLFLDHTAKLAGGEIALANLLGALDRDQVDPRCLLFENGPLVERLRALGVAVDVLPLPESVGGARKGGLGLAALASLGGTTTGFIRRLAKHLRSAEVDLVYCNSLKSDLIGGLAAKIAGLPCVWHVHDRIEPDHLPKKVVTAFRFAARVIPAGVVVNSRCTLATLRLPASKPTTVAYPGVVLPNEVTPEPSGPPTITIVGRLAPWKGQHVFLEAAALVRRSVEHVRFHIVGSALFGEDAYEQELRDRAARADLAGTVDFRGFRSDVAAELSASTIVVHASTLPEPFGQTVVEAMAAGRAVVAADAGGPRETIEHGRSGLLVQPSQPESLATAIVALLRDPEERNRLAENAQARVADAFTIGQTAFAVQRFLHSLKPARTLDQTSSPSPP